MYKPRKIAKVKFAQASKKNLTQWIIFEANRAKTVEQISLSKSTFLRYIKELKAGKKTVTELFSVDDLNRMIELANDDWVVFKRGKNNSNKKNNLDEQEDVLKKTLKERGWGPSTDQLDFAKALRMEDDTDQKDDLDNLLGSWSDQKKNRYFEYKTEVTSHE